MFWENICVTAPCLAAGGSARTLFAAGTSPEDGTGAIGTRRCSTAAGSAPGAAPCPPLPLRGSGSPLPCAWEGRAGGTAGLPAAALLRISTRPASKPAVPAAGSALLCSPPARGQRRAGTGPGPGRARGRVLEPSRIAGPEPRRALGRHSAPHCPC